MREWILENTTVTKEEYDNLINCSTINGVVNKKQDEKKYNMVYDHPFTQIKLFTLKKPTKLRCILFGVKKEKNYFLYKDIKFKVLAEVIPSLSDLLYSMDRNGTCFKSSLDICCNIEDSKIITALCKEPAVKEYKKFIHSVVSKVRKDGVEVVFDATLNILMEKDKYLELLDAKIICEIDREKMINDINYLQENNIDIDKVKLCEYFCFPKQVMEGVKKYIKTK